jgi:hypothetical protein
MKMTFELALQKALSAGPIKFLEGKDVRKDVLHCIRLAKKTRRDEYVLRHQNKEVREDVHMPNRCPESVGIM